MAQNDPKWPKTDFFHNFFYWKSGSANFFAFRMYGPVLFWCWQFFCQRGSNLLQLSRPQYFCMQYNIIYRTIQGNAENRRHFYEVQTCRNCRARIWDLQHIGRQSHNLRIPLGTVRLLCSIRHHFRCNLSMIIRHLNGCLKNISVTKLGTLHLFRLLPWKWSKAAPQAKGAEGGACLGQLVEWTSFCLMFKMITLW